MLTLIPILTAVESSHADKIKQTLKSERFTNGRLLYKTQPSTFINQWTILLNAKAEINRLFLRKAHYLRLTRKTCHFYFLNPKFIP